MKFIIVIMIFQTLLYPDGTRYQDDIITVKDLRHRVYINQLRPLESIKIKDEKTHIETPREVEGKEDALNDIHNGVYGLVYYGYRQENLKLRYYYLKLLLKKYNIRIKRVAGCVVNNKITDHARGYNETMLDAIKEEFGEDVFLKTKKEAIQMYEDKTSKH